MARPGRFAQTVAAAGLLSVPLGLAAQEDGGAIVGLRYTERLLWEEDEVRSRSDLGIDFTTETRNQYFRLDAFGGVEKSFSDGLADNIEDPRLSLDYGLESRNSALTAAVRYRRAEIDSLVFDEDLPDPALVLSDGDREDLSARLGLELGREAPFGASLSLGYSSRTYSDASSSPFSEDSETLDGSLRLRFDLSPRIRANTTYSASDLDRDTGVDVRRDTLSVGAALIVSPVLETQVDIGTTRVVESGSVPRSVEEGLFFALAATRILKNGTLTGSLTSNLDENGRRETLQIGRALELPAAALSFGVGVSQSDESDLEPLYSFSYAQELPRGEFDIALSQSFGTDSVGNETLDSRLRMRWQQDLTPLDRISAEFSVRNSDRTGTVDTRFASIGLDYSRTLTEDWSLVSGYTHTRRTQGTGTEEAEDTFFIGLSTIRQWRP